MGWIRWHRQFGFLGPKTGLARHQADYSRVWRQPGRDHLLWRKCGFGLDGRAVGRVCAREAFQEGYSAEWNCGHDEVQDGC